MMRSPINGSRGPRYENSWDDWSTHRWVLSGYPPPFEDLGIPTEVKPWHGEDLPIADWTDDAVYAKILDALNTRQMRCDVPLNLTSTSLITNAFMYTGDESYRRWVVDYLEMWAERIEANGGICPDNIGPSGQVGETLDGKWWGGYYGWRWPHGLHTIIEPLTIAAMNAVLLTGDLGYLDIPRSQIAYLIERGRMQNDQLLIPYRHTDEGWTSFRPLEPKHFAATLVRLSERSKTGPTSISSLRCRQLGSMWPPAAARATTFTSAPGIAIWTAAIRTIRCAFLSRNTPRCCGAWTRWPATTAIRRSGTFTIGRISTRCAPRRWCN